MVDSQLMAVRFLYCLHGYWWRRRAKTVRFGWEIYTLFCHVWCIHISASCFFSLLRTSTAWQWFIGLMADRSCASLSVMHSFNITGWLSCFTLVRNDHFYVLHDHFVIKYCLSICGVALVGGVTVLVPGVIFLNYSWQIMMVFAILAIAKQVDRAQVWVDLLFVNL